MALENSNQCIHTKSVQSAGAPCSPSSFLLAVLLGFALGAALGIGRFAYALVLPGFVNLVVLCEVVWVLRRGYRYSKSTITDVVELLLSTEELLVEKSVLAWRALRDFEAGKAD